MSPDCFQITSIESRDQEWVKEITCQRWGAEFVVVHGEIYHPWKLKGFIARGETGENYGLVTYTLDENECEVITLDSFVEGQGVGSALLSRVIQEAVKAGCSKVQVTTTNDNQRGSAFYRRKGFQLKAVDPGAVERARELKPSIPLRSPDGVPIRDELRFELILDKSVGKGEQVPHGRQVSFSPLKVVQRFNACINEGNLESLSAWMTEDHTFIDSSGEAQVGKAAMVANWKEFFASYPDYQNHFDFFETRDNLVLILGHSTCSYEPLDGPAIWTARVRGRQISEWRVYLDTRENRQALDLPLSPDIPPDRIS